MSEPPYSSVPSARLLLLMVFCIHFVLFPEAQTFAQQEQDHKTLYAVVHIDLDSSSTVQGMAILKQYVSTSRRDANNLSMQLLQERGRPNHLTLIEGWRSEASYAAHLRLAGTKEFRSHIQPLLGSPFDERLHYALPASF